MLSQLRGFIRRYVYRLAALSTAILMFGCTHFSINDCPDNVLGNNEAGSARLRTSHFRVMLADPSAAAARFLPYAVMSTYAYKTSSGCNDPGKIRVDEAHAAELRSWLISSAGGATEWQLASDAGMQDARNPGKLGCEDDQGLMFHVWHRKLGEQEHVVISFRGTSGPGDFWNGNLWWFRRAFTSDTQLSRARHHAIRVMQYFDAKAKADGAPLPRYTTTGHSLGGGLAQHVLYAFPQRIEQAIVFDPSSVTGFADTSITRDDRVSACSCKSELNPEARIIRIYQTYEILSNLRIFHKIFLPPERHIQEVRFPFASSWNPISRHSMYAFTKNLRVASSKRTFDDVGKSWFASKNNACTSPLINNQLKSCAANVSRTTLLICPQ